MRIEKILVGFLALSAAGSLAAEIKQPVRVTGGLVSGFPGKDTSVTVFKAIPFAAPPVGELRWRPPAPAAAWEGVKSSREFSTSCMQTIQTEERQPWTREFMTHNQVAEDCLYLNVFTPARSASERRPVLVYIYGGGFNDGSAAVPIYDGEGLAKKGVVMVTFNYRLNIMGFFVHPDLSKESPHKVSGNYGLLDQIAALKWVQANIAKFGGDPGRVTIAGQSAGGVAIHQLIASPLARGLFHRAIVQSGGSTLGGLIPVSALATSEAVGQRFAESKGAKSIAELRAMSWQKLTEPIPAATGVQTAASGRGGRGGPTYTSAPIVDGYVLPASPNEAIAQGKHADVPVLTGMDRDELAGIFPGRGAITLDSYRSRARERYGADADKFLALYPASGDQEAAAAQKEADHDQSLVSMYLWARMRSQTSKTKVFQYLFDHPMPGPESARLGAFHSAEVIYVLNTLYSAPNRPFVGADQKIADVLSSYWANFAENGDPNGKGLPVWPAWGDKRVIMEIGDKYEPVPAAGNDAKFAFFEALLTRP